LNNNNKKKQYKKINADKIKERNLKYELKSMGVYDIFMNKKYKRQDLEKLLKKEDRDKISLLINKYR